MGELGSLKNGMNFSKEAMGHGFPFINLQNIFGNNVIDVNKLELADATEKQLLEYSLLKGDVLFVRSSVKLEGVGEAALVPETLENTTYSGFIIRFRDEYGLNNDFKKYIILKAQEELQKHSDIKFEFEEVKYGRRVESIKFFIFKTLCILVLIYSTSTKLKFFLYIKSFKDIKLLILDLKLIILSKTFSFVDKASFNSITKPLRSISSQLIPIPPIYFPFGEIPVGSTKVKLLLSYPTSFT